MHMRRAVKNSVQIHCMRLRRDLKFLTGSCSISCRLIGQESRQEALLSQGFRVMLCFCQLLASILQYVERLGAVSFSVWLQISRQRWDFRGDKRLRPKLNLTAQLQSKTEVGLSG